MRRLMVALLITALPTPAFAWWEYGHETVAAIAWANIRPQTRVAVRRLLARQALLDTPKCPARTIKEASVWADCIKPIKDVDGRRPFDYAFGWHFQNVSICRPFDLTAACKEGNCVSAQIERDVATLRDRTAPAKARVQALVFLIHLVGDLHQPLHAGDKDDRGGNDVSARYGDYAPSKLNLHSIWDGYLAERAISTGPSLVRRYPRAMRMRLASGTVTMWSRESWQVAHDMVYATALDGDPCEPTPPRVPIDEAKVEKLIPVVRLEIERGGLRLAKLLDKTLG